MSSGEAKGAHDLMLAKDGPGRLYYRIGLRYAPASLALEPARPRLHRRAGLRGGGRPEATSRATDDGTWHIKAGARVRVRLTMVAPSRRYHVALVDPLPGRPRGR